MPGSGRQVEFDVEVAPVEELARSFRARLEREAARVLAGGGRFRLAISGGSVAEAFLPGLAGAAVDWERVDLHWLDERAVPPDSPDSNFGRARSLWLDGLAGARPRIHRLRGEAGDLEAAAAAAEAALRRSLGEPPRLDLALAGVGPDGHVASLFPGRPAEPSRWVAAVTDSPKPPPRRLTMTLAALAAIDLLIVAAFGEAKAGAVAEAVAPGSRSPAARAVRAARRRLFLLDDGAARLLPLSAGPQGRRH